MNIVDRLTQGRSNENTEEAIEHKMRRDVLFSQLRAKHPHLGAENIDLSEVDFSLSDDALRLEIGKARGITGREALDDIDLDEILSVSGAQRRRARRDYLRARGTKTAKASRRFRRNQGIVRRATSPSPSGSDRVKTLRAEKAAQRAIVALMQTQGVHAPTVAEEQLRASGHPAILRLDELRAS